MKKSNSIKSLIDHIKREIVSLSAKPLEIRDDTFLDKLIKGDDNDDGESEPDFDDPEYKKGLLWPPYYHDDSKWWSYFWYIKNKQNFDKFKSENPQDSSTLEKFRDRFRLFGTLLRLFKRTGRFLIWLIYIIVGSFFALFKGKFESVFLGIGTLSLLTVLLWLFAKPISVWVSKWYIPVLFFLIGLVVLFIFVEIIGKKGKNRQTKDHKNKSINDEETILLCIGTLLFNIAIVGVVVTFIIDKISIWYIPVLFFLIGLVVLFTFVKGGKGKKEKDRQTEDHRNKSINNEETNKRWWLKVGEYIDNNGIDVSRKSEVNAILLSLVFVFSIYCIIEFALFFAQDVVFFQPEISITETGVVKMTQPCGVEQYLFVQSSADLWNNTGIEVVEGDKIEVNYSGAFYSTIRDMNKASVKHISPRYRIMNSREYGDSYKEDSIIRYCVYNNQKNARIGQLLLQITPSTQEPKNQIGNDSIFFVDLNIGKNSCDANLSGKLHFAVNDIYLKDNKNVFNILKNDSINVTLRCEILNRALYPISLDSVIMNQHLGDETFEIIKKRFVKFMSDSVCADVLKELDALYKFNIDIQDLQENIRNNVRNLNDRSERENLYKSLEVKTKEQNKITKKILRYLENEDQIDWNDPDFWYNDNAGDLLVNVKISRGNLPFIKEQIFRMIENRYEKYQFWEILLFDGIILLFVILALFIDYWFTSKR